MLLESSFRPRFSKYPKPKRGIGPGSLKTGAKEGYRPRSNRTRNQKVAGSQGYRPQSKETRCQKGVNGFGSSNNRSHTLYLGFKIREPLFRPAPPVPLSLSASTSLPQNLPHAVIGARAPPPRRILPRRRLRSPQLWPRGPPPSRGDLRGRADQSSFRVSDFQRDGAHAEAVLGGEEEADGSIAGWNGGTGGDRGRESRGDLQRHRRRWRERKSRRWSDLGLFYSPTVCVLV